MSRALPPGTEKVYRLMKVAGVRALDREGRRHVMLHGSIGGKEREFEMMYVSNSTFSRAELNQWLHASTGRADSTKGAGAL